MPWIVVYGDVCKILEQLYNSINKSVAPFTNTPSKVWDEITYPFLNFNGASIEA